ncbi:hypothetical protein AYL99_07041 [Fonsecaea erecta]|uniref:Uncharacterized protein n=1 Tax=Fonsecaea erecta TaxID=1367422 RepID=A0A178ZEN4_9EURO|nr:hypothetical protein AYL99_07041 [Fonsecaea erecta]OAP57951.1 hypothetical protein AYL99_07041 [Fonsecaea erecta]
MPSSRKPQIINTNIPSLNQNLQPLSSGTDCVRSANSSLYNLRLMPPAPPPRIRTEENSPPPDLATLVKSAMGRPRAVVSKPGVKKAAPEDREEQEETSPKTAASRGKGKAKRKRKRRSSSSEREPDFTKYVQRMKALANNPPTFIGPLRFPGEPLPQTLTGAAEWDKMLWSWKLNRVAHKYIHQEYEKLAGRNINRKSLLIRFCKLKEQFALSGEINFPDGWLEQYPGDIKYQIISERTKDEREKKTKLISARTKAMEEIDSLLWETVQRIYREDYGQNVSCGTLKAQWKKVEKQTQSNATKDNDDN